MSEIPITIIVRDPRENPRKCSVLPLKGRADMAFFTYPATDLPPLDGYIRLAAEGPALSIADAEQGILLLDGSWRSAGKMTRAFEHVPPRSLAGWRTAYPRVSKRGTDPDYISAGLVLTGGTSRLPGLDLLAEQVTRLPARIGMPSLSHRTW